MKQADRGGSTLSCPRVARLEAGGSWTMEYNLTHRRRQLVASNSMPVEFWLITRKWCLPRCTLTRGWDWNVLFKVQAWVMVYGCHVLPRSTRYKAIQGLTFWAGLAVRVAGRLLVLTAYGIRGFTPDFMCGFISIAFSVFGYDRKTVTAFLGWWDPSIQIGWLWGTRSPLHPFSGLEMDLVVRCCLRRMLYTNI